MSTAQATERPAEPGELCTCGRQAVAAYLGGTSGPTGCCRIGDGARSGLCSLCGSPRHSPAKGCCPKYRLRLDSEPRQREAAPCPTIDRRSTIDRWLAQQGRQQP